MQQTFEKWILKLMDDYIAEHPDDYTETDLVSYVLQEYVTNMAYALIRKIPE